METAMKVDFLLIEDNPQDAELVIRIILKSCPDACVATVEDGAEALDFLFCRGAHARRSPSPGPKMVLLDLKLPKVDGLEVLRQIKQDERTRMVPVVVLTSSAQEEDIRAAYRHGANSYVVKPIEYDAFSDLLGAVSQYWLNVNQQPGG